jgi:hypothetical protein
VLVLGKWLLQGENIVSIISYASIRTSVNCELLSSLSD